MYFGQGGRDGAAPGPTSMMQLPVKLASADRDFDSESEPALEFRVELLGCQRPPPPARASEDTPAPGLCPAQDDGRSGKLTKRPAACQWAAPTRSLSHTGTPRAGLARGPGRPRLRLRGPRPPKGHRAWTSACTAAIASATVLDGYYQSHPKP